MWYCSNCEGKDVQQLRTPELYELNPKQNVKKRMQLD